MKNISFETLYYLFSKPRLSPYLQEGDNPQEVINKYHLNITLSEALIPILHYLEICLRNRLDQLFCKLYGPNWLMIPPKELIVSSEDLKKIEKISFRIRRENKREPTHDDIVSQMTFGFWCSFFHRKYDPIIWHRKEAITTLFPNLQRINRKRSFVEPKILKIKEMRNQIAHHEPIWNRGTSPQFIHSLCLELLEAISYEALTMLKDVDRFQEVNR